MTNNVITVFFILVSGFWFQSAYAQNNCAGDPTDTIIDGYHLCDSICNNCSNSSMQCYKCRESWSSPSGAPATVPDSVAIPAPAALAASPADFITCNSSRAKSEKKSEHWCTLKISCGRQFAGPNGKPLPPGDYILGCNINSGDAPCDGMYLTGAWKEKCRMINATPVESSWGGYSTKETGPPIEIGGSGAATQ